MSQSSRRAAGVVVGVRSCVRFSLLACAGASLHLQALAATPADELRPVVVTAQRSPQRVDELLADVSVIERDAIERAGVSGVADLLARLPGVQLARNGGPGTTTSLFVRGAESRHVLVVIDGVRVDSQSTGGAPWEALPLAQIERIELLRGAACAVWGSDAMGGVVQIFTRKGGSAETGSSGEPVVELGLGAGQQRSWRSEASARGASGALDWSASITREGSRGFNARPAFNGDVDGYRATTAMAQLGLKLDKVHRLEAGVTSRHLDARYDASRTADDHSLHELDSVFGAWAARWRPGLRSRVQVGETTDRYDTRPSVYHTDTRVRSFTGQVDGDLGAHHLNAVLERREDLLHNSDLAGGQGQRAQDGLGLGWRWNGQATSLQANARQDADSEFGSHATGALAAGWRFAPGWHVNVSTATHFRAPTLYQRFSIYGPGGRLVPEQGHTQELGLGWQAGEHSGSLVAYRSRYDHLIIFGPPGLCTSTLGCYDNLAKASVNGVTLQGATRLAGVSLSASVDALKPQNDVTGRLQPRRARRTGLLRAETDVATWRLGAQVQAVGSRWDNAANTTRLGGYALLDLDASWRISPQWRMQVSLNNALDKPYQTANGYASPPRNLFVMLRWTPPR